MHLDWERVVAQFSGSFLGSFLGSLVAWIGWEIFGKIPYQRWLKRRQVIREMKRTPFFK